jgi:protoporphyrinogen/coproporphyrinogen III oxidase
VTRVVVVGGGISGLATAHALLARDSTVDVLLLESSRRLGGNIVTVREDDGFVIDGGPDSWVRDKPHATKLATSLGMQDALIETIPENRRAFISWRGALHPFPEGFVMGVPTSILPILRTRLFSPQAKLRMALEPFIPRRHIESDEDDESIASFVRRRLGSEVTERLVAPLLGGIYGGDAGALSMKATLPRFVEIEQKQGSLIHALQKTAGAGEKGGEKPSSFTSLRAGVGSLTDRLASVLGEGRIRLGAEVARVTPRGGDPRGRFVIDIQGIPPLFADHVVLATPAHVAAKVLAHSAGDLASLLGEIPYVSTAVVVMAFRAADVSYRLDATGYIVPRGEGRAALAVTWITSKWRGRAPDGQVLMRVFLGGVGHDDVVVKDDAELTNLARAELARTIGIGASPTMTRAFRFVRASPQPLVGHPKRMRRARELLAKLPGLAMVASGYDGVGIPDCVRQAEEAARLILPDAR